MKIRMILRKNDNAVTIWKNDIKNHNIEWVYNNLLRNKWLLSMGYRGYMSKNKYVFLAPSKNKQISLVELLKVLVEHQIKVMDKFLNEEFPNTPITISKIPNFKVMNHIHIEEEIPSLSA